jgi:hypothetical protein
MATDWKLSLSCNSTSASNAFVAADSNNMWQSRAQGTTGWNNAGNSTPQAKPNDNMYVSVVDGGNSASALIGVIIGGRRTAMAIRPGDSIHGARKLLAEVGPDRDDALAEQRLVVRSVFDSATGQVRVDVRRQPRESDRQRAKCVVEMDPEFDVIDPGR